MQETPDIPWPRLAGFVRQHTHDVRNHLNSLELEASLLAEFQSDPEASDCLKRMRTQIRQLAASLRSLSSRFQEINPMASDIAAADLIEVWKEQLATLSDPPTVEWKSEVTDERVTVDVGQLASVLRELLNNAKAFGSDEVILATVRAEGDRIVLELLEPKEGSLDPSSWGASPLSTTRRDGYGLGLWEVRRVIEANGGEIRRKFLPETNQLVTTIGLPKFS
jgi:signal transduction histidine kinase